MKLKCEGYRIDGTCDGCVHAEIEVEKHEHDTVKHRCPRNPNIWNADKKKLVSYYVGHVEVVKTTTEELEAEVEKAEGAYHSCLFAIAEKAFKNHVKPFCEKRGWGFLAGNGTYCFFDENGDPEYMDCSILYGMDEEDEEFRELVENICDIIVDNQTLGSLMPDHETKNVHGYHGATKEGSSTE